MSLRRRKKLGIANADSGRTDMEVDVPQTAPSVAVGNVKETPVGSPRWNLNSWDRKGFENQQAQTNGLSQGDNRQPATVQADPGVVQNPQIAPYIRNHQKTAFQRMSTSNANTTPNCLGQPSQPLPYPHTAITHTPPNNQFGSQVAISTTSSQPPMHELQTAIPSRGTSVMNPNPAPVVNEPIEQYQPVIPAMQNRRHQELHKVHPGLNMSSSQLTGPETSSAYGAAQLSGGFLSQLGNAPPAALQEIQIVNHGGVPPPQSNAVSHPQSGNGQNMYPGNVQIAGGRNMHGDLNEMRNGGGVTVLGKRSMHVSEAAMKAPRLMVQDQGKSLQSGMLQGNVGSDDTNLHVRPPMTTRSSGSMGLKTMQLSGMTNGVGLGGGDGKGPVEKSSMRQENQAKGNSARKTKQTDTGCPPQYPMPTGPPVMNYPILEVKSDWTEHIAPDGRRYWWNKSLQESTWRKPEEIRIAEEFLASAKGWKVKTSTTGRRVYEHKVTHTCSMDLPAIVQNGFEGPKTSEPTKEKQNQHKKIEKKPNDKVKETAADPQVDNSKYESRNRQLGEMLVDRELQIENFRRQHAVFENLFQKQEVEDCALTSDDVEGLRSELSDKALIWAFDKIVNALQSTEKGGIGVGSKPEGKQMKDATKPDGGQERDAGGAELDGLYEFDGLDQLDQSARTAGQASASVDKEMGVDGMETVQASNQGVQHKKEANHSEGNDIEGENGDQLMQCELE